MRHRTALAICLSMLMVSLGRGQSLDLPPNADAPSSVQPGGESRVPSVRNAPVDPGKTFGQDTPFTVYGKRQDQRSRAYSLANETRMGVIKALRLGTSDSAMDANTEVRQNWKFPIVIHLSDEIATPTREAVSKVRAIMPNGSISLSIHAAAGLGIPTAALREQVVRQVLADLMLRRADADKIAAMEAVNPPDWMVYGCLELMTLRQRSRPSDLFAAVFRLGKTLTVQEIMGADVSGLDSVTMGIYRVSACALLQLLLEQPDGSSRLLGLLAALLGNANPMTVLEAYYPQMRGQKNSLEKWWSLQLAASSQPGKQDLLDMQESDQALTAALTLRVPKQAPQPEKPGLLAKFFSKKADAAAPTPAADPTKPVKPPEPPELINLAEFPKFIDRTDRKELLQQCNLALTGIGGRVHPFYRGLLRDYLEVLGKLTNGKTRGVADRLKALEQQRQLMVREARETEDILDKYEAIGSQVESGNFRDYLRTAEEIDHPPATSIPEISDYLDKLEHELNGQ